MPKTGRLLVTVLLTMGVLAVTGSALAKDDDVRVRGTCTGSSTAKLKVGPEDGRLEVELEVDQNRNGVRWQVVLRHNGERFFRGSRTTSGPSGSFEVRRLTTDRPGVDTIRARARSASGEVCVAIARI